MEKLKKLFKVIGPGFITGASDDDPSGIGTYSQTGAQFGYTQLWTALFSYPFMTVIQEMCGRIGMVTGKGLAGIIKRHYPRWILYFSVLLLVIANTINIGADLGAMASSGQMLLGVPFIFWLLTMTVASLILQVLVPYPQYARFLKYLTLALFAYIITAFIVKQPWHSVLKATFIPSFSFSKPYLLNIVAILGTTISPYLFFWQANEEVEQEIEEHKIEAIGQGRPKINKCDIRDMRIDTMVGMLFSNLVMYFIIVTVASTLGVHNIRNIETATQAAQALKPLAGDFAFLLFAAGIIGTGFLAVPILAGSASYAVAETFGWDEGLGKKFNEARGFYGVIIACTLIGLLVNFTSIPPFKMLYYTAIFNGLCAPPLMIIIMLISNNQKIMGKYTNSGFSNAMGWIITILMTIAAIAVLLTINQG